MDVVTLGAAKADAKRKYAAKLPSVGERLRRANAAALARNSVDLGPMTKPPTITTGSASLNAAKTQGVQHNLFPGRFRLTGGIAQTYATAYTACYAVTLTSGGNVPGDNTKQANQYSDEFWTDDPRPMVPLFGTNPFMVEIDGQAQSGAPITPASGTPNYVLIDNTVGSATIAASGGIFTTPTAHGLSTGDQVELGPITTTTGASANVPYWVISTPTATTFTLSATPNGSALALTGDGSTTSVAVAKPRHYRFELAQGSAIRGVNIGPLYSSWAPRNGTNLRMVVVGDSIEASTGTLMPNGSSMKIAGKLLGITDVRQVALGGTGFTNGGTYNNTFGSASRVADVVAHAPDILVITLTQNDDLSSASAITAAALAAFQAYRAALPNVPIVVTGVDASSSGPSAARLANDTAGHAAFTAWADPNSWFIENANDPSGSWFTGTGNQGSKNGTGNRDRYGAEGAHPNTGGHRLIGTRWAQSFRTNVLPYIP